MNRITIMRDNYVSPFEVPPRFRAIDDLAEHEKNQYDQIRNRDKILEFRKRLLTFIDDDLVCELEKVLEEWAIYGLSVCENSVAEHRHFKSFYDEVMQKYAVRKAAYNKVDFAAQKITHLIVDKRCLDAKLSVFQVFKAAYQLGEAPAVSNFRFMYNSSDKSDGKYREWMFHFDNSNYAAEFKLITTRSAGTSFANVEQCLAAFPYDTRKVTRFTQCEAATKFTTMRELESEFCGIAGAAYAVIRGEPNGASLETGIRTEMILHHRSATEKKGSVECRDSELMTFHGAIRCRPFLTKDELVTATFLTPLQYFVLGGFKDQADDSFFEAFSKQSGELNHQLRNILSKGMCRNLADFHVAEFPQEGVKLLQEDVYQAQKSTYDDLAEIVHQLPKLTSGATAKEKLYRIIPALMNFDQNAALKPDCSENLIFPARTQLRERVNADFLRPITADLSAIVFSADSTCLMDLSELVLVASTLGKIYQQVIEVVTDNASIELFRSRSALAQDYVSQLIDRVHTAETHQTIVLFIYYMLHDLEEISVVRVLEPLIPTDWARQKRRSALQHFVTYRMIKDLP